MTTSSSSNNNKLASSSSTNMTDLEDPGPSRSGIQDLSLSSNGSKDKEPQYSSGDLPPSYQAVTGDKQIRFRAGDYADDGKIHVLLAASGPMNMEILPAIVERLVDEMGVVIQIVLDQASAECLSLQALLKLPRVTAVYIDADWQGANSFLHFELRSWLDFMLVAPCDPSTLAKMINGIGDDLLTSILRVFDADGKLNPPGRRGRFKYLAIAPAMDSATWAHPLTKDQLSILKDRWSYVRPFGRTKIPWAITIKPLNLEMEEYGTFEDNGNLSIARIMMETCWQVDKFRKGHAWYTPGK